MNEFLKSLKNDIERVYALWILNNMDLVSALEAYVRLLSDETKNSEFWKI